MQAGLISFQNTAFFSSVHDYSVEKCECMFKSNCPKLPHIVEVRGQWVMGKIWWIASLKKYSAKSHISKVKSASDLNLGFVRDRSCFVGNISYFSSFRPKWSSPYAPPPNIPLLQFSKKNQWSFMSLFCS